MSTNKNLGLTYTLKLKSPFLKKDNKQNQELKLKTEALEIINSQYQQHIKIFTDDSKITQPYKTAAALVIPELNVQMGRRLPDFCSIYTAEFWAILESLKWIELNKPNKTVIISDSLSVLSSIHTNHSKSREKFLKQINTMLKNLTKLNLT